MTDSIDISMEDMVAQYRDEVSRLVNDKMLLQAAVKNLGLQVTQLASDLELAVDERTRLAEVLEGNGITPERAAPYSPPINRRQHYPSQFDPPNLGPGELDG